MKYQFAHFEMGKRSRLVDIQYSAIRLYRHLLGINFYVDIRKCRYIETLEKEEINK